ncbi:MAG: YdeI/OmpD-associated family protein [Bacteroidota bacterium]
MKFTFEQTIKQLEKRKGGYFYLKIDSDIINQYDKKRHTRLVCTIDSKVSFSCGLNHIGDGNYFIIVASKHLKKLGKEVGAKVSFEIMEDPNPLGVEMPEVLDALLSQDEEAKQTFETMTDGKKRSLVYTILKVKDIDEQVHTALQCLQEVRIKLKS